MSKSKKFEPGILYIRVKEEKVDFSDYKCRSKKMGIRGWDECNDIFTMNKENTRKKSDPYFVTKKINSPHKSNTSHSILGSQNNNTISKVGKKINTSKPLTLNNSSNCLLNKNCSTLQKFRNRSVLDVEANKPKRQKSVKSFFKTVTLAEKRELDKRKMKLVISIPKSTILKSDVTPGPYFRGGAVRRRAPKITVSKSDRSLRMRKKVNYGEDEDPSSSSSSSSPESCSKITVTSSSSSSSSSESCSKITVNRRETPCNPPDRTPTKTSVSHPVSTDGGSLISSEPKHGVTEPPCRDVYNLPCVYSTPPPPSGDQVSSCTGDFTPGSLFNHHSLSSVDGDTQMSEHTIDLGEEASEEVERRRIFSIFDEGESLQSSELEHENDATLTPDIPS